MSRKIYIIIAMVFTVVLSVSTFFIIRNHIDSAKQNEVYDNLAEIVEDEPPKENEGVTFSEDKDYLAEYFELYRQNEDMVGWIKVEDTNINYPVVQSVNEPNFYLKHKFDKTYSAYGCPYVQENCDVQKPSDNIIIYGHHMNDGSMFTGLMKYRNKSFWEGHKTVTFDTLTDRHQYEVIAVFVCGSSPSAIAGRLSVNKLINNRCTGANGTGSPASEAYNTARIPPKLPESRN